MTVIVNRRRFNSEAYLKVIFKIECWRPRINKTDRKMPKNGHLGSTGVRVVYIGETVSFSGHRKEEECRF